MAEKQTLSKFDELLDGKPALDELCTHVNIAEWHQLGVMLKLDVTTLARIKEKVQDPRDRLAQVFSTWLATIPRGTRREMLAVLKAKPLEEVTVAEKYREYLLKEANQNDEQGIYIPYCNLIYCDLYIDDNHQHQGEPMALHKGICLFCSAEMLTLLDIMTEVEKRASNIAEDNFYLKALVLQDKYFVLLAKIQTYMDKNANIDAMKSVMKTLLQHRSLGSYPDIEKYIKEIDQLSASKDLFAFLINNKFIGYLHYHVLEVLVDSCGNPKLEKKIEKYKNDVWKFIEEENFAQLVNVFTKYPDLQPSTVLGLPLMVVHLVNAWKKHSMRELKEYLPFVEEQKVALKALGLKCIKATFVIFPQYFDDIVSYIQTRKDFLFIEGIEIEVKQYSCTYMYIYIYMHN